MVVAINNNETYRTELLASGHGLIADEAQDVGGTDLGPSPGIYLQMSLASCTAITLRMYANRKKMPLGKIRVEVGMERETEKTLFQRHLYLEGPLDQEQRERLLQIANACPVHKTLIHPIEITTLLKD